MPENKRRMIRKSTNTRPGQPMITAPSSASRDRNWEKSQRSGNLCQISYRAIPIEIREGIKELAQERAVSADEIGRLALETFLAGVADGSIEIPDPTFDFEARKMTIYGGGE